MKLKALFPNASQDTIDVNSGLQDPKPQRDAAPALGSTVPRKTESVSRATVRFTGYRTRPLDWDNFCGGCKNLFDGLCRAGILLGDEPWRINFQARQIKVYKRAAERTVIEIEY